MKASWGEANRPFLDRRARPGPILFIFDLRLKVDLDGDRFFERAWHEVVPRHLV